MAIADLIFIDSAGYHYADFPSFLSYFTTGLQEIYGADIYLGSDSQDGQFTGILAQAGFDVATRGAAIFNSFAPPIAQGVGLARLVKLNGLTKRLATNSTVDLVIVGTAGTTLTDSIAVDALQQQWLIPSPTTIPGGGTITVTATAKDEGAVAAQPNTITGIFTPTQGWQTVNNPSAATLGAPVESDAQLRVRQTQSVALPSQTVFEGTVAAVQNVAGVVTAKGYENATNSTDGNGLPPHSIALVVVGGDSTDIAEAIQIKKTPGTQTDGTTTIVVDDSMGMPIPISFYEATPATIGVRVTITPLAGYSSSYADLIQAAAAAVATSPMVGSTNIIGGNIILNQFFAACYLSGTQAAGTFTIDTIELKKNAGAFGSADIQLDFNEYPVCIAATDVVIIT